MSAVKIEIGDREKDQIMFFFKIIKGDERNRISFDDEPMDERSAEDLSLLLQIKINKRGAVGVGELIQALNDEDINGVKSILENDFDVYIRTT